MLDLTYENGKLYRFLSEVLPLTFAQVGLAAGTLRLDPDRLLSNA
jgi:hypothetical protein